MSALRSGKPCLQKSATTTGSHSASFDWTRVVMKPTSTLLLAVAAHSHFPFAHASYNTTKPSCTTPARFANTIVPAIGPLATSKHSVALAFELAHTVFFTDNLNTSIPQAIIATSCLDQCVAYQPPNATAGPCLGFEVDLGKPYPPNASDTASRWFCTAYDRYLTPEDYVAVDAPGSYVGLVGVNRVCEGTFRAY